jgi:hypothetical protein
VKQYFDLEDLPARIDKLMVSAGWDFPTLETRDDGGPRTFSGLPGEQA